MAVWSVCIVLVQRYGDVNQHSRIVLSTCDLVTQSGRFQMETRLPECDDDRMCGIGCRVMGSADSRHHRPIVIDSPRDRRPVDVGSIAIGGVHARGGVGSSG